MIYSAARRAVIYSGPAADTAAKFIPEHKVVQGLGVAVRADLRTLQILRMAGLPVPMTIADQYDFPIRPGMTPMDHQRLMAMFTAVHPRSFNLSEMGTAKTLSTLWAYDWLMKEGLVTRAIILCPLSIMQRAWGDEIFRHFLGRRTCTILYGSRDKRLDLLKTSKADFLVINYEGLLLGTRKDPARGKIKLGELATIVMRRGDINGVIVDEGSSCKEPSSLRTKTVGHVLRNKKFVTWLTGTPTPNAPTDAWPQAHIVRLDYTESYKSFRDRTTDFVSEFKRVPKKTAPRDVHAILQPAIRFSRDECMDLPPVSVPDPIMVPMSPSQEKLYQRFRRDAVAVLAGVEVKAVHEAALRNKLIQIACGAIYDANHVAHYLDCKPRVDSLLELVAEAEGKVLVFAPLTSVVDMLHDAMRQTFTVEKVNGGVSSTVRNGIFQRFQEAIDPRVIVADPGCMSHGLTMTEANTIIWYAPTDKAEVYQQANDRMTRPGQTRKMYVYRLASTPIEKEIYRRLKDRLSMQGMLLDMVRDAR